MPQGNTTHRNDAQLDQKKRDGERLFAPPGFAPLFPELSGTERNMALQYISHSDATERQARITRVQQSLEPGFIEKDVHHPRISHDVNKGKGHVLTFMIMIGFKNVPVERARVKPCRNQLETLESCWHQG